MQCYEMLRHSIQYGLPIKGHSRVDLGFEKDDQKAALADDLRSSLLKHITTLDFTFPDPMLHRCDVEQRASIYLTKASQATEKDALVLCRWKFAEDVREVTLSHDGDVTYVMNSTEVDLRYARRQVNFLAHMKPASTISIDWSTKVFPQKAIFRVPIPTLVKLRRTLTLDASSKLTIQNRHMGGPKYFSTRL